MFGVPKDFKDFNLRVFTLALPTHLQTLKKMPRVSVIFRSLNYEFWALEVYQQT